MSYSYAKVDFKKVLEGKRFTTTFSEGSPILKMIAGIEPDTKYSAEFSPYEQGIRTRIGERKSMI
jgi:hypothetical protein